MRSTSLPRAVGSGHTPGLDWQGQPLFGELAAQLAGISQDQLETCLRERQVSGGHLGQVLRKHELLSRRQVQDVLAAQARWTVRSIEASSGKRFFPYPASLSLCMPAYNEEGIIEDTLDAALAILPQFLEHFEVVVVDDGSHDRTGAIVAEYGERDPRVRLIRHERNQGYGVALASGLRAARGDLLVISDSDGQFTCLDLARLLICLPAADVVIGYRYRRADHWMRRVNAWGWNRLIRLVLGVQVTDLDCAFKLFPRSVIEQLRLTSSGSAISAEIMVQCVRGGLKIREIPVRHFARSTGMPTGAARKVILRAFRELAPLLKYRSAPTRFLLPAPTPALATTHNGAYAAYALNGHAHLNGSNGKHRNGTNGEHVNGRADSKVSLSYRPARLPQPHVRAQPNDRLRICMLAACPFPANYGTPGSIREMAEAISDLGHEVHIVTYQQRDNIPVKGPQIHRVPPLTRESGVVVGPTVRRPIYDLQMVFKTREVIRAHRPHLIHAHAYEAALVGWLACRGTGIPLLYSGHNTMADELPTYDFIRPRGLALALGRMLDAFVPRLAERCVPHSANLHRFFCDRGLGTRLEPVVNFGIDLDAMEPDDGLEVRQRYQLDQRPVIGYAGILDEFQRLDLLLEAMKELLTSVPQARLLIIKTISNPKHELILRDQANRLGLADKIVLTDPVSLEDIPKLLSACDVAVVPRPGAPGFPIKLLNYLATRRPCVLFASSASNGLIHRENAMLVAPDTGAALGEALREVLQNTSLRQHLARNGHRLVRERYDRRVIAERVCDIYRRLLAGTRIPPTIPVAAAATLPATLRRELAQRVRTARNGTPSLRVPETTEILSDASA